MFGDFPVELLRETFGYVSPYCHVRKRGQLTSFIPDSPTLSTQRTMPRFENFVLRSYTVPLSRSGTWYPMRGKRAWGNGRSCWSGLNVWCLRYVKTLKIGAIEGRMVAIFYCLISRLQDHSLVHFEWDSDRAPLNSQLAYIWDHKWNIQSIDIIDMMVVKAVRPWKSIKFPQKYVHISLEWPRQEDHEGFLEKLDLSCMNSLRVKWAFSRLPSSISTNLIQITNLKLHDIVFFDENFELDSFASLLTLGLYRCMGAASILSNFKNPKILYWMLSMLAHTWFS